jgi:hypothetical protein
MLVCTFLSTVIVRGAILTNKFVGFGSEQDAREYYVLPSVQGIDVVVYQNIDGKKVILKAANPRFSVASYNALSEAYQQRVRIVAEGATTNSMAKKDQPFFVTGLVLGGSAKLGSVRLMTNSCSFMMQRNQDGSYSVPTFPLLELSLEKDMLFEIKDMNWCRIEKFCTNPDGTRVLDYQLDSRPLTKDSGPFTNGVNVISLKDGYVRIDTKIAISGEAKLYLNTVSGTNNNFRVFGGDGKQVAEEIRNTTPLFSDDGFVQFEVIGETGRVLQVQCSSSVDGPWTDDGPEMVVSVLGYPPLIFRKEMRGGNGFYRVRTVNKAPY